LSELPIEFRVFDGRHHGVLVCDKDAGFKQAILLIRRLLLIAVGHWSTWSKEAFLTRDKLGADWLLLPRIIRDHGNMAKVSGDKKEKARRKI
jgi:hypothetical protein